SLVQQPKNVRPRSTFMSRTRQAQPQRQRRVRLRHSITFAATCIALAVGALAVAQPTDVPFPPSRPPLDAAPADVPLPPPRPPEFGKVGWTVRPSTLMHMQRLDMDRTAPILIRIYKTESVLEIWKQKRAGKFALLMSYPICKYSGRLGPKLTRG